MLVNVLDNALRHGARDQPVEVSAHAGAESAKLEIVDHGPGLDRAAERQLFEPFQRLDDHDSTGIGLGLSVARGFVEAMDGAMVADATAGGGLTMRIAAADVATGTPVTRVLIVEDERGLRQALGINLRARDYEVTRRRGRAHGADRRRRASRRTPWCSTSACPTSTGSR